MTQPAIEARKSAEATSSTDTIEASLQICDSSGNCYDSDDGEIRPTGPDQPPRDAV